MDVKTPTPGIKPAIMPTVTPGIMYIRFSTIVGFQPSMNYLINLLESSTQSLIAFLVNFTALLFGIS